MSGSTIPMEMFTKKHSNWGQKSIVKISKHYFLCLDLEKGAPTLWYMAKTSTPDKQFKIL